MKTDNELIAEFMGLECPRYLPSGKTILDESDLLYNTSWDWLMPVVEKIGLISTGDDDFYYPRTFGMRDADGNYLFRFNRNQLITAKTLIEATYGAVVEFIKWHNDSLT